MSEKKVVKRSVAIALGIICIVILVGLAGAIAYYTMTINDYDHYALSHSHTDSQFNTLNSTFQYYIETHYYLNSDYDSYAASHSHTNSEYDSSSSQNANLQNQVNSLMAPKLVSVNLLADDNRTVLATPYLHVHGNICNVGTNTAYYWTLHVVGYQSGGVVAIHTFIDLGIITGESWTSVDLILYYNGSALTSWTMTPIAPIIIGG